MAAHSPAATPQCCPDAAAATGCGPCQLMHKELDKMTPAFKKVRFAKLNCGKGDQQFATRQRIRSLPTFRVYHRGACLDEVTGAKPVQLRQLLTHYSCLISM